MAGVDTTGDDSIVGTDGAETISIALGGADTVDALGGNDYIDAGGALSADDRIDGGGGIDILTLDGDYSAGLTFDAQTIQNVEYLSVSGNFDYALTLNDGNVAAGQYLLVETQYLGAGHTLNFDGSGETDGTFDFSVGSGTYTLTGGAGDDTFNMQSTLSRGDVLDGGAGMDSLALDGAAQASYRLHGDEVRNIDWISVISGGVVSLTLNDDVVAAGQTLRVDVNTTSQLNFDGSAERDGNFLSLGGDLSDTLIGGKGADTLHGDGGDDRLTGNGGGDQLLGGDGADTFVYVRVTDSTHRAPDDIQDLTNSDIIDLSAIDARTDKAGDQAFQLVSSFTGQAGEATLVYSAKTGQTKLSLDVNGDGKADAVILIDGDHHDFTNFVL